MLVSFRPWLVGAATVALFVAPACDRVGRSNSAEPSSGRRLTTSTRQAPAQKSSERLAQYVKRHYEKREVRIPMRDGATLFTSIYTPKDDSRPHPFLLNRTPYSVKPYGEGEYPETLGPSPELMQDGFIFVYQDVRGRFMSDGDFTNMTPHRPEKAGKADVDESSDTYDTIAWLLEHVDGHNGKVGQWGISYPGFYAAAGMIDAHPALAAVSPQAPVADWWFDDFRHHGAFFLPHCFNFMATFGRKRDGLTKEWAERFQHGTPDGYHFFYELGSLRNVNERHFKGEIEFWNDLVAHPDYDGYWQARNLLPHLNKVAPAVMTVGGWFDAENLYGALAVYHSIEQRNPDAFNMLVMGPWRHGGWARTDGDRLGNVAFGEKTAVFYRQEVERRFFNHFLEGKGDADLPEAYVFETGANRWRTFETWPPEPLESRSLWLAQDGTLQMNEPPKGARAYDQWVSDPKKPVPFSEEVAIGMTTEYMTDDQRFAGRRPDVMVYQSEVLEQDITLAGPLVAKLWVSTSASDADFVVKLIDVLPHDTPDHEFVGPGQHMGGYQMLVRSEVLRGRYRDGYERPRPFRANLPTAIDVPLQDTLHTFRAGHRIMVQIQSTWFPLVDRNPQKWVANLFEADDADFVAATHRVYRDKAHPSRLQVGVLRSP